MRSPRPPGDIATQRNRTLCGLIAALPAALAAVLASDPAAAACSAVAGEMNGAAGQPCEMLFPLRWENRRGMPMRHESLTLATSPTQGRVSIAVQSQANRAVVSYRPSGGGPVTDRFSVERCGLSFRGDVRCTVHEFSVNLSEQGAARAAEACLPRPFEMRTDRPVDVRLEGPRGGGCLLRLFLAQDPISISVSQQPSGGAIRIARDRVRYSPSFLTTSDAFQLRVCKRADPGTCSVLNVTVALQ